MKNEKKGSWGTSTYLGVQDKEIQDDHGIVEDISQWPYNTPRGVACGIKVCRMQHPHFLGYW